MQIGTALTCKAATVRGCAAVSRGNQKDAAKKKIEWMEARWAAEAAEKEAADAKKQAAAAKRQVAAGNKREAALKAKLEKLEVGTLCISVRISLLDNVSWGIMVEGTETCTYSA